MFGVVGPVRMYGENGLYKHLLWAFLIGAVLTVGAWGIMKKWPNKLTKCELCTLVRSFKVLD